MQIKKYISLILSFLILVANMGLMLNVHYCKGQISEVTFAYEAQGPCNEHHKVNSCCGIVAQENHKSCCKNDVVELDDTTEDIILVKSLQLDLASFCPINEWKSVAFYGNTPCVNKQATVYYCAPNAPPLFKLYCSYMLYA
ncbi:HYC_CC_PP family protein [Flavobacterium litorale]|uniref:Uncharacterized protein n=1 Tax=Flavobacterium litorale TaxID=2856519 RepID=A0ABX8V934_9FLAO|nr:hypothetical protein [Flavobacterium litorale]QYJ67179.1 hypothetical protein K1I41_06270 [Flavobacterium litorale]